MKKLVTALLVVLPLVLLIALFAITGIVKLSVDIAATGISINNKGENGDGIFLLDMAEYSDPLFESELGVEVMPLTATNRAYSLSVVDLNGNPTDIVERSENGAFLLKNVGTAKLVYTSKDGGYSDSVIFNVIASKALDFMPVLSDPSGAVIGLEKGGSTDYKAEITSGNYSFSVTPSPAITSACEAEYESSDSQVMEFKGQSGEFKALFGGKTNVKISMIGAGNKAIEKTVELNIVPAGDATINGIATDVEPARLSSPLGVRSVRFALQAADVSGADDVSVSGVGISDFRVSPVESISGAYFVTIFLDEAYTSQTRMRYNLKLGEKTHSFYVDYADRNISIYSATNSSGSGNILILAGSALRLTAHCEPSSTLMRYNWRMSDERTMHINFQKDGICEISAPTAAEAAIYLDWEQLDEDGNVIDSGVEQRKLISIKGYTSLMFAENAESFGLGGFTLAGKRFDGNELKDYEYSAKFRTFGADGKTSGLDDIVFKSSDESIAEIYADDLGVHIKAKRNGTVTVTAEWKYKDVFGVSPASFKFTCSDGVLVSSDAELRAAFKDRRAAVLANDIYLGEQLFNVDGNSRVPKYDDAAMKSKLLAYTGELLTSADYTYYENIGESRPTVRYCLDITADLFGNGHTISAEYITNMLDSTDTPYDFALFKGPLDFVATSSGGVKLAAVKAQDNIGFLVRTDGVKLENVCLKNCDDKTLYEDGGINLSLLNNMGTTLEIMSDAKVSNSRIMNGRTAVRIFGRDGIDKNSAVNAALEQINAEISGCVIQNAREFLLKIGTNRAVKGTPENPSPALTDRNGNPYPDCNNSEVNSYLNDEYFTSNLLLTTVTLKDSVLKTSGLFSIGMETHFSGIMLAGGENSPIKLDSWHDLAATSYPALLRLEGDVVLADWKEIDYVDSSTLIESNSSDASLSFLTLNVKQMLETVQQFGGESYKDIISKKNGKSFVHGGIAFYGGGRNYSIVDTSEYTFEQMNEYAVNLSILQNASDSNLQQQGTYLPYAAGLFDFRFVMFDGTSRFDYDSAQNY